MQKHVMICSGCEGCDPDEDARPPLEASLRQQLADRGLTDHVHVETSDCLEICGEGITLVVVTDGVWYSLSSEPDVTTVVEKHLLGGTVVTDLRIDPPDPPDPPE